jgi:hypothetical protein
MCHREAQRIIREQFVSKNKSKQSKCPIGEPASDGRIWNVDDKAGLWLPIAICRPLKRFSIKSGKWIFRCWKWIPDWCYSWHIDS